MFVKVVRGSSDSVFECDRVHRRPDPYPEGGKPALVSFDLESHKPGANITIQVDVEDRNVAVYYMADDGKTIERFGQRV
ncbi:MAG TPA: hypothetical protein DCP69_10125 [Candidatus Omnitrophica bacterium]|nr:hypothetical protein [Candidatus Omnitrophota bacterium]